MAMRMVELHVKLNHGQGQVIASAHAVSKNMREWQKKPMADVEMTEARWRDFENQWARYKHASGVSGQDVVDTLRLEVTRELEDG